MLDIKQKVTNEPTKQRTQLIDRDNSMVVTTGEVGGERMKRVKGLKFLLLTDVIPITEKNNCISNNLTT